MLIAAICVIANVIWASANRCSVGISALNSASRSMVMSSPSMSTICGEIGYERGAQPGVSFGLGRSLGEQGQRRSVGQRATSHGRRPSTGHRRTRNTLTFWPASLVRSCWAVRRCGLGELERHVVEPVHAWRSPRWTRCIHDEDRDRSRDDEHGCARSPSRLQRQFDDEAGSAVRAVVDAMPPPSTRTCSATSDSPRPLPLLAWCRASRPRQKRSKMWSRSSAVMPFPRRGRLIVTACVRGVGP